MPKLKRPTGLAFTFEEFGRFPAPHQKRILKLLQALGKTVAAGRMSIKYNKKTSNRRAGA